MSEFFSNLIDRHLGTRNVVAPRTPSRFETEVGGSATPLPIDYSGTDETGDQNLERQDSVDRLQENHSVEPPVNWSELQRTDREVKLPADHTETVDLRGDNLERQDSMVRIPGNLSVEPPVNWSEPQRIDREVKLPADHTETVNVRGDNLERQDSVDRLPINHSVRSPVNWIEPQRIDGEVKLPADHTESDDAMGDNLERQDSVNRLQENHSVGPPVNWSEPQRIDPVHARGNNLEHQDNLIRPTASDSISVAVNAPELEPQLGTQVLRQQDWQSAKPNKRKPVEQTNPKEENTPRQVIRRHSTVVTETQQPLSEDLSKRIADSKLNEEANGHTSERGYRFENELGNRIRATLAQLGDRLKIRPTEHPETNNLPRPVIRKPVYADVPEKDQTVRPLSSTILFDEPEKAVPSVSDQEQQQAIASTDRDMPWSGSLEPPSWLSEVQTQFNRQWNETNRKCEPEPVINVTIGRVEVRAVKADPPQRARRKRKPSGVMSLDEYLNQRERRG